MRGHTESIAALCALALLASAVMGCASTPDASGATSASETPQAANASDSSDEEDFDMEPTSVPIVVVGDRSWVLELERNPSTEALEERMNSGLSLHMTELNGNEKYAYLDEPLPSDPAAVGRIEAGDVMLYGDDCLVIFYRGFDTTYSYTRLGHVYDAEGLADALGEGDIDAELYLEWSE